MTEADLRTLPPSRGGRSRAFRPSVGVIPGLVVVAAMWVSYIGAAAYVQLAELDRENPFTAVWAAFSPLGSAEIMLVASAGAMLACLFPSAGPGLSEARDLLESSFRGRVGLWFLTAVVAISLMAIAKGPYLMEASNYLQSSAPSIVVSAANLSAPIAALSAGVVFASRRVMGSLLFVVVLVVLFAYGTRFLGVAPMIFVAGQMMGGIRTRLFLRWAVAVVSAALLIIVPLHTRGLSAHGLIPYARDIVENGISYSGDSFLRVVGNIGFTAPIAEFTAERGAFPPEAIWAALNPSPSDSAGWAAWAPLMRAHFYIPYSMIGEFASLGYVWLFLAMFVWSLLCRLALSYLSSRRTQLAGFLLLVSAGLISMSALYLLQYNTRSVTRILSLVGLVVLIAWIESLFVRSPRNARTLSDPSSEKWNASPAASCREHLGRTSSRRGTGRVGRRQYRRRA